MCSENLKDIILGVTALICLTVLELTAISVGIDGDLYKVVIIVVSLIAGVKLQPTIKKQLKKIKTK